VAELGLARGRCYQPASGQAEGAEYHAREPARAQPQRDSLPGIRPRQSRGRCRWNVDLLNGKRPCNLRAPAELVRIKKVTRGAMTITASAPQATMYRADALDRLPHNPRRAASRPAISDPCHKNSTLSSPGGRPRAEAVTSVRDSSRLSFLSLQWIQHEADFGQLLLGGCLSRQGAHHQAGGRPFERAMQQV